MRLKSYKSLSNGRSEKLKITDDLVLHKPQRPTQGECSAFSVSADGNSALLEMTSPMIKPNSKFKNWSKITCSVCRYWEQWNSNCWWAWNFFEGICEREVASQLLFFFIPIAGLCILLKESFLILHYEIL
jgi:hypothetical protein